MLSLLLFLRQPLQCICRPCMRGRLSHFSWLQSPNFTVGKGAVRLLLRVLSTNKGVTIFSWTLSPRAWLGPDGLLPGLGWPVSRQGHSPPHLCRCSARGETWALSLLISSWCSSLGSLCRCSLSWWSPCSRTHCSSAALSGSCFSGRRNQCTNIDRCRPRFGHLRRECSICHCPNFLHRVPDRLSIMILPIQPQPSSCRQHPLSLRIGESGSCVISSLVRLVLPRTGSLQGPGPSVSCVLRHEFGRSQNSEPLSAALVCRAAVCITIDVVSSSAL